jgi:hypothetical protein
LESSSARIAPVEEHLVILSMVSLQPMAVHTMAMAEASAEDSAQDVE